MKKLNLILIGLCLVFVSSCDNEFELEACGTSITAENTSWFGDLTSQLDTNGTWYILKARYKTRTVFIPHSCCAACLYVAQVYSCDGELLGNLGSGDNGINPDEISNEEVVWRSSNFVCSI